MSFDASHVCAHESSSNACSSLYRLHPSNIVYRFYSLYTTTHCVSLRACYPCTTSCSRRSHIVFYCPFSEPHAVNMCSSHPLCTCFQKIVTSAILTSESSSNKKAPGLWPGLRHLASARSNQYNMKGEAAMIFAKEEGYYKRHESRPFMSRGTVFAPTYFLVASGQLHKVSLD